MIRDFPTAIRMVLVDRQAANRSARTIDFYANELRRFFTWVEAGGSAIGIAEITPHTIRAYLVSMEARGLSAASRDAAYRALGPFFKFCVEEGLLESSPMTRVSRPTVDEVSKPIFTQEEIKRILAACDTPRDTAIVACLLDTGVRASELLRWKVEDIDLAEGTITILGKNRRERTVFLGSRAKRYLIKWLVAADVEFGHIWIYQGSKDEYTGKVLTTSGLNQVLRRIGSKASVSQCNPHKFRRTFAVQCLRDGMDIFTLQRLMGHRSLDMLKRYLTLVNDDLAKAHRKHSPLDKL